ncbi:endonuclease/exonuclease/phosphatase family protein [Oceanobacillus senegalensis]|uniref:endonuclease/exonuclease/phosphatase family protein n=1 Tax=Oceanobacillus senegalensis TaxID=1936063 RepID=UPI001FE5DB2F|nr:endonuclease/exonuclease/phosphatase family protein [Oceanobacillus senegalensis]
MRKRAYFLTTLAILIAMTFIGMPAFAADEFSRGEAVKLNVMSYNIHHAVGEDNVLDLERIAQIIKESNADIIGLQEVDNHWSSRSDFQDQAKWLADRLDMFYTYAANLDYEPLAEGDSRRQYGTAVLSKYPILDSENHSLPKIGNTEQRGLLETTINVKGTHLHFYNTHLALTSEERKLQINKLVEITRQADGPKVIVGDLNATPKSEEMKQMYAHFADAFVDSNDAYTYSADNPSKRIDYIFTSNEVKTDNAKVIGTQASDHLPILTELIIECNTPFENGR